MFFNTRSLITAALFSLLTVETSAAALRPITQRAAPENVRLMPMKRPGQTKRDVSNDVRLMPLKDLGELTGHFVKRDILGNDAFNPVDRAELYWGSYAGDTMITANFTLYAPNDDLMILPIENFAQHLKKITCGQPGQGVVLEFNEKSLYDSAHSKWLWLDAKPINHFILVTEAGQCYSSDDRSPYTVKGIKWDDSKLTATIDGEERPWEEVADEFDLKVSHTYVDPATVNITHPHLMHKRDDKTFDLKLDWNKPLFEFKKDSKESAGLGISANAHVTTGGSLLVDFEATKKHKLSLPSGVDIKIHPKGAWGQLLLSLQLDGKLGKPIDWELPAKIQIPVGGFSIFNIVTIGPIVEMGIHFGTTALEGVATFSTGAKAKLKDSAEATFSMKDSSKNGVNNDWEPSFEQVDPRFSAEIKGGVKAWAELSFKVEAVALGSFGYSAGIEAELPYIEANIAAKADTKGVCNSKKALGLQIDCSVGINVHLEAGQPKKAPDFQKGLFDKKWPLYSTCMGFGNDISTATTGKATATDTLKIPDFLRSTKPVGHAKPSEKSKATGGTAKSIFGITIPTAAPAKPSEKSSAKPSKATSGTTKTVLGMTIVIPTAAPATTSKAVSSGTVLFSKAVSNGSIVSSKAASNGVASSSGTSKPVVSQAVSSVVASGAAKPVVSSAVSSHVSSAASKAASSYSQVAPSSAVPSAKSSITVSGSASLLSSSTVPVSTGVSGGWNPWSISVHIPGPKNMTRSTTGAIVSSYVAQTTMATSIAAITSAAGYGAYY